MAAAEQKPLSNLPQLIPEAVFMEDVQSFVKGARPAAGRAGMCAAPLPLLPPPLGGGSLPTCWLSAARREQGAQQRRC